MPPVVHLVPAQEDLEACVERASSGSIADQRRLVVRVSGRVSRVLHRTMGPDPDLADLTQEALAEFLQSLHRLRDPRLVDSFAERIAVNLARALLRRRRLLRAFGFGGAGSDDLERDEAPSRSAPDYEARAALRELYSLLDRLTPDARLAFVLRHAEQRSLDEVAQALGCSLATAKRRLVEANARLEQLTPRSHALLAWLERNP